MTPSERRPPLRGLVVDYGGVLTRSLGDAMSAWAATDAVDLESLAETLRSWHEADSDGNPVSGLETGRISAEDFERTLAPLLRTRHGSDVPANGLLARMFAQLSPDSGMFDILRRARRHGIRTALLSNSWGLDYPRDNWQTFFDAIVISGEVGMRKPDPDIYRLAAGRLGLSAAECVFVDDLAHNVAGAVAVGMVGVHHEGLDRTLLELEAVFDVELGSGSDDEPAP